MTPLQSVGSQGDTDWVGEKNGLTSQVSVIFCKQHYRNKALHLIWVDQIGANREHESNFQSQYMVITH